MDNENFLTAPNNELIAVCKRTNRIAVVESIKVASWFLDLTHERARQLSKLPNGGRYAAVFPYSDELLEELKKQYEYVRF